MTRKLAALRLSLALAALSMAAGCQGMTDPSPMPRGYVFHKNPYKTIPGAKASSIGVPYTLPDTARATARWRMAARDLVARLADSGALAGGPVFVSPASPGGRAFDAAFDHALRGALIDKGFVLAAKPGQGPTVSYALAPYREAAPAALPPPLPSAPPAADIVRVETAPPPIETAPLPLDVPPVTARPAPAPVLPAAAEQMKPRPDDLSIAVTVYEASPDPARARVLARERGIYMIPGADSYDWSTGPAIPWKPVVGGRR